MSKDKVKKFLIPPAVILLGILLMGVLSNARKKPAQIEREFAGVLVEIMEAQSQDKVVTIKSNGTVTPRDEVMIMPQVGGKIVWVNPKLESGGFLNKDEELVHIEKVDYELAVQQAEAMVAQAEVRYQMEVANSDIARKEWELVTQSREALLGEETQDTEPDALVLRQPQMKQAEADLASAIAMLESAKLNLDRTVIKSPFNARVRERSVSVGQLVGQASVIASLYATDLVEIVVGLPASELMWINIPGAKATLSQTFDSEVITWNGKVDRTVGVMDRIGRLAQVVIQVKKPQRDSSGKGVELAIGSFVDVEIEGIFLENKVVIPRKALHENNTVWLAGADDKLQIRKVEVKRLENNDAVIESGIESGENIIITSIAGAAEGMKIRTLSSGEQL